VPGHVALYTLDADDAVLRVNLPEPAPARSGAAGGVQAASAPAHNQAFGLATMTLALRTTRGAGAN
jgi:hypothetical protein